MDKRPTKIGSLELPDSLSRRAIAVLRRLGVASKQQLILESENRRFIDVRGCGKETAEELTRFVTDLRSKKTKKRIYQADTAVLIKALSIAVELCKSAKYARKVTGFHNKQYAAVSLEKLNALKRALRKIDARIFGAE